MCWSSTCVVKCQSANFCSGWTFDDKFDWKLDDYRIDISLINNSMFCDCETISTKYLTMAICLAMTFGRLGSVLTSNIIGMFIERDCELIFNSFSGLVLVCFVLSFFKVKWYGRLKFSLFYLLSIISESLSSLNSLSSPVILAISSRFSLSSFFLSSTAKGIRRVCDLVKTFAMWSDSMNFIARNIEISTFWFKSRLDSFEELWIVGRRDGSSWVDREF